MKIKKMVGALALSAALAMGTVPAFAASATTPDPETDAFSNEGSTEIKAKIDTINTNVRATVPLQATVVFGGKGGSTIIGPSKDAYCITNVGDGYIKIVDAELSLSTAAGDLMECAPILLSQFDSNTVTGNKLMFYYTTDNNATYLTDGHKLSQATSGSASTRYMANAKGYAEDVLAPNESLPILLGGKAYFNDEITNDDLTDTLCTIKYTIAAADE